jgi:hypothetical protein
VAREDVARHNTIDKVLGWALPHERVPAVGSVLHPYTQQSVGVPVGQSIQPDLQKLDVIPRLNGLNPIGRPG